MGCSSSKSVQVVTPVKINVRSTPTGSSAGNGKARSLTNTESKSTVVSGQLSSCQSETTIITDIKEDDYDAKKEENDVVADVIENDVTKEDENDVINAKESDDTKREENDVVGENDESKKEENDVITDVRENDAIGKEENGKVGENGETKKEANDVVTDVRENDDTKKEENDVVTDVTENDDTKKEENGVTENGDSKKEENISDVKETEGAKIEEDNVTDVRENNDTKIEAETELNEGDEKIEKEAAPKKVGNADNADVPEPDAIPLTAEPASPVVATGPAEIPPLCPPTKTKEQLIPEKSIFKDVDDFVRNVPSSATSSVKLLADYLTASYSTDLLKIRAIFCWVAFNIKYDTETYFSGAKVSQDDSSVLKSGKAVCQGYSQLFDALCKVADIPCMVISGIAKGFSHDPEDVYTEDSKTNHAWNLVLVQGEWRPLDSTWGAGHIDKSRQFNRKFKDHWFLTDPNEFVLRHFPLMNGNVQESQQYQLLHTPMTLKQYSAHVRPESLAHAIGLQYVTHDHTVIDVTHDVIIQLKPTRNPLGNVSVSLTEKRTETAVKDRSNVLAYLHDDGTCTIYVRPPRTSTYLLDIMGRTEDEDSTKLHQLLTYVIRCKETKPRLDPFPDKSGVWGLSNPTASECGLQMTSKGMPSASADDVLCFSFNAKEGEVTVPLQLSQFTKLKTQLRHASAFDTDLAQFTFIEYTQDGANITARLSNTGYYMLRVFASHPEKELLHHTADFLLFADKETSCQPFPGAYALAYREKAKLLQPLCGEVPAGEVTLFRVKAPTLAKVSLAGKLMELKNDEVWEVEVEPEAGVKDLTMFAAVDKDSKRLEGLFKFSVSV